jgi:hypothetical protein
MRLRIKLRYRDPAPTPWRWEIFDDTDRKLVTAASHGYATRDEAHREGAVVAADIEKAHAASR